MNVYNNMKPRYENAINAQYAKLINPFNLILRY